MNTRKRYFISEVDDGGGEWKAGNRSGYATGDQAWAAAEKLLAKDQEKTYCVALYEIAGEDRDCLEVLGYVGAEASQ